METHKMNPYAEQLEAVKEAIKRHRGTICMPTGVGKSVTMALLINELQVRTLIIVPNLNLKNQLKQAFTKYFGSLKNITIENINSSSLINEIDYDCLIIDEAHHVAARTYQKLNKKAWNSIYYRFFFTATPFRSRDDEQLLMESISGKVIYRIDYKTAVDKHYIVPIEAYYYELPKVETDAYTWQQVYAELVVNNVRRNNLISDLLYRLQSSRISTLCLVKEIKHGEILKNLSAYEIPFANGQDEDCKELIDRFNSKALPCLIGTTGILGEGVDTKPCEYVIIAGLGKSKNAFMQQVGRAFRTYTGKETCKVILFKDPSHKFTWNHFKTQVNILKEEYGVVPVKLEV